MKISTEPTPNVSVRKAKHIIPVRDALKHTLKSTGSSPSLPRPISEQSGSVAANELNFLSPTAASTPPPITPPPPPPLHSPQPIYRPTSQISQQSVVSAGNAASRLFAYPYFRSQFLQHLHFGSGRRSTGNQSGATAVTSSTPINADQVDRSNAGTMKSYLSSADSAHSSHPTAIGPDSILRQVGQVDSLKRTSSLKHSSRNSANRSSSKSSFGSASQRESRRQRAMAAAAAAANRSFRRPTYQFAQNVNASQTLKAPQRDAHKTERGGVATIANDSMDAGRVPSISSPSPHSNEQCDELNCSKFGCKSASGFDCESSCHKRKIKSPRTRLTRPYWEQFLAQRLFLLINCALLCLALVTLVGACILDPRPLHHLNSRGGFFAFNSCIALFLSLLGLYGVQRRQQRLLQAYATTCACLLLVRLAIALAMLPSLSQFSLQLIAIMCIALFELLLMLFATHLAAIFHKIKRPSLLPDQTDRSTTTATTSNNSSAPTPINPTHSERVDPQPSSSTVQTIYNERPVDVMDQLQVSAQPKSFGQDNPAFHPDSLLQASPLHNSGSRRGRNYSNNLQHYTINYDHLLASTPSKMSSSPSSSLSKQNTLKGNTLSVSKSNSSKEAVASNSKFYSLVPPSISANVSYANQSPLNWEQIRSAPPPSQPPQPRPISSQPIPHISSSAEPPHSAIRSRHGSGALSTQPSSLNPSPALFRREGLRQSLAPESPRRFAAGSLAARSTPDRAYKGDSADSGRGESALSSTASVFTSPLANVYRNSLESAKSSPSQPEVKQPSTPTVASRVQPIAVSKTSIFDYNYTPINLSGLTSSILQHQTPSNKAPTPNATLASHSTPSKRAAGHQRTSSTVYSQLSFTNPSTKRSTESSTLKSGEVNQKQPLGITRKEEQSLPSTARQSSFPSTSASSNQQTSSPNKQAINNNNNNNSNSNSGSSTGNVYSSVASNRSQIKLNRMNFLSNSNQQQTWSNNSLAIVKSVLEEEP